ncbi:MAG: hypothetical protein SFU21_00505 [Flavihumibacter sp.]|nr:hypothetical protein [Flavihumibacter sp.]
MHAATTSKECEPETMTDSTLPLSRLKIWVLVPYLETEDPNLQYYYDFSQSLKEYTQVFKQLNAHWHWQPVTLQNFKEVIASIKERSAGLTPLVLNLCDGDEINSTPGISVIHELEKHQLIYTGASAYFYDITTSKIPMKQAFDAHGVANAAWTVLNGNEKEIEGVCEKLGAPLIIKPAISGGSMGVSVKNVVHTDDELLARIKELNEGYRGWQLTTGGLFAEQFISGPEFTTFIVGSYLQPDECIVYPPVERIFHASLPETEKFLSFDRLWEIYEQETPMPGNGNFYEYHQPDSALVKDLQAISLQAYIAVKGTGYGRLDIRMDSKTGKLYMLEVNAQCGLSDDEDYTSIGAILRYAGKSFASLILEIVTDAWQRHSLKTVQ